jgi:Xaa-Pro aminopeptidase
MRTDLDLFSEVWTDRPALPQAPVYEHAAPQAPLGRAGKLALVREAMARHGATHHLISTVDDLAWLTNLRGSDVDYNPVFLAHLLIGRQTRPRCSWEGQDRRRRWRAPGRRGLCRGPLCRR